MTLSLSRNQWLAALAAWLVAATAGATQYSARLLVDQRLFHDDNIRLSADKCRPGPGADDSEVCRGLRAPVDTTGYELSPQLRLGATGPRWELTAHTQLRFTRFSEDGLSSDDQFLDIGFARTGERGRFDLETNFDRTNTRTEILELDEFVFDTARIERWEVAPAWTRSLTELDSLVVGGSYGATQYAPLRFSDYDHDSLSLGWLRRLDEKSQLQVTVYRSSFDSGERPTGFTDLRRKIESETDGLQVSYTRQFSEVLSGSFAVGARTTETTTTAARIIDGPLSIPNAGNCGFLNLFVCAIGGISDDSDGFTASAGLDYSGEVWSLSASLSRSLVPNGLLGGLLETDRLALNYTRVLGERVEFDFRASLSSEESLGEGTFARDRWTLEPSVTWRFAERWHLTGSVRYRLRDFERDLIVTEADGTAVILRLRYSHPRARWSR